MRFGSKASFGILMSLSSVISWHPYLGKLIERATHVASQLSGGQQMPDMRDTFCPIHPHKMPSQQIIWCACPHVTNACQHCTGFLYRERHPLITLQKPDVVEDLIPNARFIMDMKRPALLLGMTPCRLPLRQPFAPVL